MSISTTAPSIGWLHPWPEWIWMILIAVCVFTSIWAYRRTDLPSWVRWSLTTLRFAILMIVLVYISGPVIETRNQERVDDKVIILLDRSASMTTMDVMLRMTRRSMVRNGWAEQIVMAITMTVVMMRIVRR